MKARRIRFQGTKSHHNDAVALLQQAGDIALVKRGYLRSAVINCPDGCGEIITINMDTKSGAAWRLYQSRRGTTLYPSVWRDTGCKSHFIIWDDRILLLDDWDHEEIVADRSDLNLERQILECLKSKKLVSYVYIADQLRENPWTVLWICEGLVRKKLAVRGSARHRDYFRRV